MKRAAEDVDTYIAGVPEKIRQKLEKIRAAILAAAPGSVESISYQMPYYARRGNIPWRERSIAWFGLQSRHIGLYIPPPVITEHKKDLKGYATTKSAVHLPLEGEIPLQLIKKLVRARLEKNGTGTKALAASDLKEGLQEAASPAQMIDARISELGDWRAKMLSEIRALVRQADPGAAEEWKWNNPVWSHNGIICTGETYKNTVKMTFARGASLEDPSRLFNSSLKGSTRRAIDFQEGDKIDGKALKALIRAASKMNRAGLKST